MSMKLVLEYRYGDGEWTPAKGVGYSVPYFEDMDSLAVADSSLRIWIEDKGWTNVRYRLRLAAPVYIKRVKEITTVEEVVTTKEVVEEL